MEHARGVTRKTTDLAVSDEQQRLFAERRRRSDERWAELIAAVEEAGRRATAERIRRGWTLVAGNGPHWPPTYPYRLR